MGFWGPRTAAISNGWDPMPASPLLVLLAAAGWAASSKGGGHWSYIPRVDESSGLFQQGCCSCLICILAVSPRLSCADKSAPGTPKAASCCHGSRSAALLPDAFCHQSHNG
ncbi:hypothetical protein J3F84DRAFT_364172 [Trichoderma pleuroticola]